MSLRRIYIVSVFSPLFLRFCFLKTRTLFHPHFYKTISALRWLLSITRIRGGVEDTRLEAKDTKKSEAKAKDSLSEDRPSRGQGQECSRTKDTSTSILQKQGLQNFFSGDLHKKRRKKNFQPIYKILTIQKIVLSSRRGQGSFRGLEATRPRPRTSKCVLEDSTSDAYIDENFV